MVRGMTVEGGRLHGGAETCRSRVALRARGEYSQTCQAFLVRKKQLKRRETGLYGQNVGWCAGKTVSAPSLGFVPKGEEFSHHLDGRGEKVPAIPMNWEE